MNELIFDRSNSYLKIFTKAIVVDKNLPKWAVQRETIRNEKVDGIETKYNILDGDMDLGTFLNLDKKDFNIYLGKRIASDISKNFNFSLDEIDFSLTTNNKKPKTLINKITKYFRNFINSVDFVQEEVYELNIFDFFDKVKLTAKENQSQYALRIEPYIIALKQAQDMGQEALVDNLTAEIFNNKYESILYSEGFHNKLNEQQIVDFIKKTEKGVQLCYIKNFLRPIPQEVIDMKKKADELLVFDNYCVMYYDPEQKSYKMTMEEEENLRKKKADPILFGMISGSRNLYYVADWIDEYCDLTLDEFIKVSGIEKQHLEITKKIKL